MQVDKSDIFGKFYENDLKIDMEAVEDILQKENPLKVSNLIIEEFQEDRDMIQIAQVDTIMRKLAEIEEESKSDPETIIEKLGGDFNYEEEYQTCLLSSEELEKYKDVSNSRFQGEFNIFKDITGGSGGKGEIDDFISLFNNRVEKLSSIAASNRGKIVNVSDLIEDKEARFGGLVKTVRDTKNDNKLVEVEDQTGEATTVFNTDIVDEDVLEKIDSIVPDEYVCIEGKLDECGLVFGNDVHFPDTARMRTANTSDRSVKAVFISDTHFGSTLFAKEKWKNFVKWIREEEEIEYLFIGGDLVEGVGIYPGQLDELAIPDIKYQYNLCADAFDQIPDRVKIFASIGNHDMVRLAEPQPALGEPLSEFFGDNVELVGSPCHVNVEGVNILLYHGNSLNQMDEELPDVSISKPEEVQKELLKKRHMSPVYGGGTSIAPEPEDYMVIEDVPDIFQCGHTHTLGMTTHNRTNIINSGCWVEQTLFQKKLNIDPDVGYAYITDLSDLEFNLKQF